MLAARTCPVLEIERLRVRLPTADGVVEAVRAVTMSIQSGECLAVVGESGSGKTQTFMAVMGLLPRKSLVDGSIRFRGTQLAGMPNAALNRLRGSKIAMIFQDPLTALTPHVTIGAQIAEPLRVHLGLSAADAFEHARFWIDRVRIPDAARRMRQYPHELSGGMRQRVMIAGAMAGSPELLIADEPTTALDVTVQADILDLMAQLKRETGTAMVLVSHDMGVVARMADRVCVMRSGQVVEEGLAEAIYSTPRSAYTRALLAAVPRIDQDDRGGRPVPVAVAADTPVVIDARDIRVSYPLRGSLFQPRRTIHAVDGVSLAVRAGETLGIVGESGCGKSTLSRAILRLLPESHVVQRGSVTVLSRDLMRVAADELRHARRDMQIVFQDPLASLDPRMTIGRVVAEPLRVHRPELGRAGCAAEVAAMLELIGLSAEYSNRYPHELSGGQNQRVCIARAMILRPRLVVCDEAVSALDVSIRADIIDLLIDLQRRFAMAMIFISHDLAVVREISHRVMVLHGGRVVETGARDRIFDHPQHPYTRSLLSAVPVPDPARARIGARVSYTSQISNEVQAPLLREVFPGHFVADHVVDATHRDPQP